MGGDNLDSLRAHAVLKHIDILKPLMLLNIDIVIHADNKLKSRHIAPMQVEYFDIGIEEVELFFPGRVHEILKPILEMFKFERPMYGTRVMLLDILIIVCFFVSAPLADKAKYLFEWFNVNKTGMMDELEHSNFILRAAHCLKTIKFLGSIDVTSAEAKYMALEARTKYENGEIKFVPGLYIYDFIKWIQKGNECKPVFKFFDVLYRLVNMLVVMDGRMSAVSAIMEHKQQSELHSLPILDIEDYQCVPSTAAVYPTFRSQTSCSFCISDLPIELNEIFIKYEKIVHITSPRFEIPSAIVQRNPDSSKLATNRLQQKCCDKYYLLKYRQRYAIEHRPQSLIKCPFQRVELNNLEPNNRYIVTLYSAKSVYRSFEISTLNAFGVLDKASMYVVPVCSTIPKGKAQPLPMVTTQIEGVTILPSNLSIEDVESFVYGTQNALDSALILFTGTICSINETLLDAFKQASDVKITDIDRYLNPQLSSAGKSYADGWEKCIRTLFGMQFCSIELMHGLYSASRNKQVQCYSGVGPWGLSTNKSELLQSFESKFISQEVEQQFEELYARYSASISPPSYEWCKGTLHLLYVKPRLAYWKFMRQSTYSRYDKRINAEDLIDYLKDKIASDALKLDITEHLVIVVATPMDLLDSDFGSNQNVNEVDTKKSVSSTPTAVKPIEVREEIEPTAAPTEAPQLRGKHELLHGEYSTQKPGRPASSTKKRQSIYLVAPNNTKSNENFDFTFHCVIQLLFDWIKGGEKALTSSDSVNDTVRGRRVTLVSTAWTSGHNFVLVNSSEDPQNPVKYIIKHENLLATQSDDVVLPIPSESDRIVEKITASLSSTVKLQRVTASCMRAIKCSCDEPQHNIEFIHIDEKYQTKPVDFSFIKPLKSLQVVKGPVIVNIGSNEIKFVVETEGSGEVTCTLFEIPTYLTVTDCEAIILADREALRVKRVETRSAINPQLMTFLWTELTPFCSYCILVEPYYCLPLTARFTTLTLKKSLVNSILLTSISSKDCFNRTDRMQKIMKLSQVPRGPPCPVVAMFDQKLRFTSNTEPLEQSDVHYAHRFCNFIHNLPSHSMEAESLIPNLQRRTDKEAMEGLSYYSDDDYFRKRFSLVYVLIDGFFCYLTPKDESTECLREMSKVVQYLNAKVDIDIQCLVVFVSRPLVVYKRRNTLHNKWVMDGPLEHDSEGCLSLLYELLEWKSNKVERSCKVICLDDVKSAKFFRIECNDYSSASKPSSHEGKSNDFTYMKSTDYLHPKDSQDWRVYHGEDGISRKFTIHGEQPRALKVQKTVDELKGSFIQHIILPVRKLIVPEVETNEENDVFSIQSAQQSIESIPPDDKDIECVLFPEDDEFLLGSNIWCKPIHHGYGRMNQIYEIPIRPLMSEINTEEILESDTNIMYRLEFLLRSIDERKKIDELSPRDDIHSPAVDEANHAIMIRTIEKEIDLIEIAVGPVIGIVTQTEAKILLEVSKNVSFLSCILSPVGLPDEEPVKLDLLDVKAYQLASYKFTNLLPNTMYNITFPCIAGSMILGRFRTAPSFPQFLEFAICGQNSLACHRIVPVLLDHINQQQSPQVMELGLLNDHVFNEASNICSTPSDENAWKYLSEHLASPGVLTSIVLHIGSQSVLSVYLTEILESLMNQAKLLELPVRDANIIGAWQFKQFEEMVKDSLRAFWRAPFVRDALSICSHVPLYHSQYLLPLSRVLDEKLVSSIKESQENTLLLQIIRKVFDTYINQYISALCNWDMEEITHTVQWRCDSLVVIAIDNVTNRRKIKRRDGSVTEGLFESVGPQVSDKEPPKSKEYLTFTEGFIDKAQWKSMCSLTMDNNVSQIILIFENPLIPLTAVPKTFEAPESLPKGECCAWSPTVEDLETFFKVWMDWLGMYEAGLVASCRTFIIVSSCDTPYSTVIQDIHSGLKIHQMCVGNFFASHSEATKVQIPHENIVRSGKIGPYRYSHRLSDQDYFEADPLRGEVSTGSNAILSDAVIAKINAQLDDSVNEVEPIHNELPIPGYSLLKVWLDSWKALGIWSSPVLGSKTVDQEAVLLVGPILGAPRRIVEVEENKEVHKFMIPILIEVDRLASIKIVAKSLFEAHEISVTYEHIKPSRPFVIDFGPLYTETRYDVCIVSGLVHTPLNAFTLNTHMSLIESNIAVINCHDFITAKPSSHFVIDIAKRCKIPFHGITAVVHTNFQPECEKLIQEVINDPLLVKKVAKTKVEKQIKPELRITLIKIMETIREKYRSALSKPAYRELLRSAYNLMMQNINPVKIMEEPSQDDDNIEQTKNLLYLMIARINQEYFDKLLTPQFNVFRALTFNQNKSKIGNVDKFESFEAYISPAELAAAQAAKEAELAAEKAKREEENPEEEVPPLGPAEVIGNNGLPIEVTESTVAPAPTEAVEKEPVVTAQPETTTAASTTADPNASAPEVIPIPPVPLTPLQEYRAVLNADVKLRTKSNKYGGVDIIWSNEESIEEAFDAVFYQWINDLSPAPHKWKSWLTPNTKAVVEQIPALTEENMPAIVTHMQNPVIDYGYRIVILNDAINNFDCAEEMITPDSDIGPNMQGLLLEWTNGRVENGATLICPTSKYGTKNMSCEFTTVAGRYSEIYMIDTIYHCNEFERIETQAERDRKAVKVLSTVAAKSKKALKKKEEEERQRREEIRKEIEDMIASEVVDGYLIIECRTADIEVPFGRQSDNLTLAKVTIVGSLYGTPEEQATYYEDIMTGLPTHHDHILLPEWFLKFSPGIDGVFIEDEVLMLMRQHKRVRQVLDYIEDGEMIPRIMELYEASRLSELSRPEDLREVNMSKPGIIAMFLQDLVARIWRDVLPSKIKPFMFNMCDTFIRSYTFSRAMNGLDELSSSAAFAKAFMYALKLSVALKTGYEMSLNPDYQYILAIPDHVKVQVEKIEHRAAYDAAEYAKEQKRNVIINAAKEEAEISGMLYDPKVEVDIIPAELAVVEYVAESDMESDLEELDNELATIMKLKLAQEEEEARQAAIENQVVSDAEEAAEDKTKKVEVMDIGRAMDETALAELEVMRLKWLEETLTSTIENVVDFLFVEGVEHAVSLIDHGFDIKTLTDDERISMATTHFVNVITENVRNRRRLGARIAFVS